MKLYFVRVVKMFLQTESINPTQFEVDKSQESILDLTDSEVLESQEAGVIVRMNWVSKCFHCVL